MSSINPEESKAISKFVSDFYLEAVEAQEKELGRKLTIEELQELRDQVLYQFFGSE